LRSKRETIYMSTHTTAPANTFAGTFRFTYKPLRSHLWSFIRHPIPTLFAAVSVFCALWVLAETPMFLARISTHDWHSYLTLIVASLFLAILWNGYFYWQRIPDGFEHVSKQAALIAHRQRPKWQFRLAKALLAEKLKPIDRELSELESGRAFLRLVKPPSLDDYRRWASTRIETLRRMIDVANQLLVQDFPRSIQSTVERPADPKEILATVDSLARFYRATVEFEREARQILTSDALQILHRRQFGWSDPARDAVHKLFAFLDRICDCDPKHKPRIEYTITFSSPPGVDEF
jgi:hypothetical protein